MRKIMEFFFNIKKKAKSKIWETVKERSIYVSDRNTT